MGVVISKPAINIREQLTELKATQGYEEQQFHFDNLVTNGTFDADTDWTKPTDGSVTIAGGVASASSATAGQHAVRQDFALTANAIYAFTFTVSNYSTGLVAPNIMGVVGTGDYVSANGTYTQYLHSGASPIGISLYVGSTLTCDIDNISVREINPLSVSIQMDGRMTYADDDTFTTVIPWSWFIDGSNNLYLSVDTDGADVGEVNFRYNGQTLPVDTYTPGVNVPFNIASRHGSTFVNGAVDGVALTADTTPTALPDLSSTDLQIASDFMGTIGTFRQFAGDIGDTGLVTATNPSTEPTLSLTFDGTDGSFYNLSWSE